MRQGLSCSVEAGAHRPAHRRTRLWAAMVGLSCAAVLVVARRLEPATGGYGTHTQLGGGPCGMLIMTGYPCPSCGMTTAFAHAVRGHLLQALLAQPAGLALALATVAGAVISAYALVSGSWPRLGLASLSPFGLFAGLLSLLLGGWVFKIAYGLLRGELPLR